MVNPFIEESQKAKPIYFLIRRWVGVGGDEDWLNAINIIVH